MVKRKPGGSIFWQSRGGDAVSPLICVRAKIAIKEKRLRIVF